MPCGHRRDMHSPVDVFATVSFPGRLVLTGTTFVTGLGATKMTEILGFAWGNEMTLTAIVTVITAMCFIAIWYLKDYEDWKASRYDEYIEELKTKGEAAKRPDVVFGRPYMYAMGLSMVITVILSIISTPYLVELIAGPTDPLAPNMAIFVSVAFFATVVLGFMSDYFIARPIADKTMKAKYVQIQESIIDKIMKTFPSADGKTPEINDEFVRQLRAALGLDGQK